MSSRSSVWSLVEAGDLADNVGVERRALGRRHREQPAAGLGQPLQALVDDVLHGRRDEGVRIGAIGGSCRPEQAEQLDREEGVALRALVHELGQRAVRRRVEQRAGQLFDGVDAQRDRARTWWASGERRRTGGDGGVDRTGSAARGRGQQEQQPRLATGQRAKHGQRVGVDPAGGRRSRARPGHPLPREPGEQADQRVQRGAVRASSRPSSSAGALPPPSSTVRSGWALGRAAAGGQRRRRGRGAARRSARTGRPTATS